MSQLGYPLPEIPQQMILQLAQGVEDPASVARRYGFDQAQFEALQNWKPFVDAVAAQSAELEASGWVFRTKARFLASDLLERAYRRAASEEATLPQLLETAKLFVDVGDLKPKGPTTGAGEGFSITIVNQNPEQTVTIQATPVEAQSQGGERGLSLPIEVVPDDYDPDDLDDVFPEPDDEPEGPTYETVYIHDPIKGKTAIQMPVERKG